MEGIKMATPWYIKRSILQKSRNQLMGQAYGDALLQALSYGSAYNQAMQQNLRNSLYANRSTPNPVRKVSSAAIPDALKTYIKNPALQQELWNQYAAHNKAAQSARAGSENWTLQDWEKYAQSDLESRFIKQPGTYYGVMGKAPWERLENYIPWHGGYLTEEDYTRASWLEKKALEEEFKQKWQEAKEANEKRYQEILSGYEKEYRDAMDKLRGMGAAAKKEISDSYGKAQAASLQNLARSGLLSSTVAPSVLSQIRAAETKTLESLNEQIRREMLQYMTGITSDRLAFMERREDVYPDVQMLLELARGLGNA